jgi:excisionase family DNA binding protein
MSQAESIECLVLSVASASKALGISRAHAYELIARCELPSIKLGRRIVVPRSKLAELVRGAALAESPQ